MALKTYKQREKELNKKNESIVDRSGYLQPFELREKDDEGNLVIEPVRRNTSNNNAVVGAINLARTNGASTSMGSRLADAAGKIANGAYGAATRNNLEVTSPRVKRNASDKLYKQATTNFGHASRNAALNETEQPKQTTTVTPEQQQNINRAMRNFGNYTERQQAPESKNSITEEQSLAHAKEVVQPYINNKDLNPLFNRYAEVLESKEFSDKSTVDPFGILDIRYNKELDPIKEEILQKTGLSDEEFDKVVENYRWYRNYEGNQQLSEDINELHPAVKGAVVAGNRVLSVPAKVLSGAGTLTNETNDPELGRDWNRPEFFLSNLDTSTNEAVHNDINKYVDNGVLNFVANNAYDLSVMMGDSYAAALSGPVGLASYGTGSYANNLQEAMNRGLPENQAQAYALVMGITEVATEKIPFDSLSDLIKNGATKEEAKALITPTIDAIVKQFAEEGGEEVINDIVDDVADNLINGDMSKFNIRKEYYMSQEYADENNNGVRLTEDEAFNKAVGERALEYVQDGVMGGLSGAGSAGAAIGIHNITDTVSTGLAGKSVAKNEELVNDVLNNPEHPDYISTERDDYDSQEEYEAAQTARENLLGASETVKNNQKLKLKEASKVYKDTISALQSRNDNRLVPAEYRNKKVSEAESLEAIDWASDPYRLALAAESVSNMTPAIQQRYADKVEQLKSYDFTQEQIDNAITVQQAYKLGLQEKKVTEEQLKTIPEVYRDQVKLANQQAYNQKFTQAHPEAIIDKKTGEAIIPSNVEIKGDKVVVVDEQGNTHEDYFNPNTVAVRGAFSGASLGAQQEKIALEFALASTNAKSAEFAYTLNQIKNAASIGSKTWNEFLKANTYVNEILNSNRVDATKAQQLYESIYDAAQSADTRKRNSATVKNEGKVTETVDTMLKQENEAFAELVKAYSKKTGVDIAAVNYNNENRAAYIPEEGKIVLNKANAHQLWVSFIHEAVGEKLQRYANAEDIRDIQNDILNYLEETLGENDYNNLVDSYQYVYRQSNSKIDENKSRREAANEMANDFMAGLFSSEKGLSEFIDWVTDAKTANEQVTVLEKLKNMFDSFLKYIKDFFANGKFNAAETAALNMSEERAEALRQKIIKALDQAIANRDAQVGQQGESATRHSKLINSDQINAIESNKKEIFKRGIIAEATEDFTKDEKGHINKAIFEYFKDSNIAYSNKYGSIRISHNGIKHTISKGLNKYNSKGFKTLKAILENGLIVDYEKNWKGRGYDTYIIAGIVDINDKTCLQGAIIMDKPEVKDDYLFDLQNVIVLDIEELKKLDVSNTRTAGSNNESVAVLDTSNPIYKLIQIANSVNLAEHGFVNYNNEKTVNNARNSIVVGDIEQDAIEHFGTTDNFRVAGYMLVDGTMLDFSGAHWLEGESPEYIAKWKKENDIRQVDHEDITEVFEDDDAYYKFIDDRGNIRLMPESPGISISSTVEPTAAQYRQLKEFIREAKTNPNFNNYAFYVDIGAKSPKKLTYSNNINEDRVVNDIKKYYETGEVSQQTNLNDFRYSKKIDQDYMAAVESNDVDKMQQLVEQVARAAGFDSPQLYHGTSKFGFTSFDLDKMDDKQTIFLTSNNNIAATYSGTTQNKAISEKFGDINSIPNDKLADALNSVIPDDGTGRHYEYFNQEDIKSLREKALKGINDVFNSLDNLLKTTTEEKALKAVKRMREIQMLFSAEDILDKESVNKDFTTMLFMAVNHTKTFKDNKTWSELEQSIRKAYALVHDVSKSESEFIVDNYLDGYLFDVWTPKEARADLKENVGKGNYSLYAKLGNSLVVDANGRNWNQLAGVMEHIAEGRYLETTRDVVKWAKQQGYDSVIFKNIKDNGGRNFKISYDEIADIYALFNPNNVKSADPVTYDDNGNVIPLSERFNVASNDLRNSIKVDWDAHDSYKIPGRNYNPEDFFNLDEAQMDAAELQDVRVKAYIANIVHSKNFAGLMYSYDDNGHNKTRFLTRSTRDVYDYQFSYMTDGIPVMHANIKDENDDITAYSNSQDMAHFYSEIANDIPMDGVEVHVVREGIAEKARNSITVYGDASPYADSINETKVVEEVLSTINKNLKGASVSMKFLDKTVDKILKEYESDVDANELKMELAQFIAHMTKDEHVNYDQMMNYLLNVGDKIIKSSRIKNDYEVHVYDEVKELLRGYSFALTDQERNELKYVYGNDWNNAFGALNAAGIKLDNKKGTSVDRVFSELQQGILEKAGVNIEHKDKTSEQLIAIIDVMEALKPRTSVWDGSNDIDNALSVAVEIIDSYYEMADYTKELAIINSTDKGKKKIQKALSKETAKVRENLRNQFNKYKETKEARFKELVEEKNEIIKQQQQQLRSQQSQLKKWESVLKDEKKQNKLTEAQMRQTARVQALQAVQSYKEAQERAKQIDNIRKTGIRMIKWLAEPTEKQHIPSFLQRPLGEFLGAIDFLPTNAKEDSKSTLTWQQRMQTLRDVMIKIREAELEGEDSPEAYFAQNIVAKDILSMMDDFLGKETWDEFTQSYIVKKRAAKKVSLLDAKELQTLNKIMSALSAAINNMNSTYANEFFKSVDELARTSYNELDSMKKNKTEYLKFVKALKDFKISEMTPVYFFEELGEGAKSVFNELRQGWNLRTKHIRETSEHIEDFKKRNGISNKTISQWSKHVNEFTLSEGTVKLTDAQIMSLYRIVNRKQGRPHVMLGGIRPADSFVKNKASHYNKAIHINAGDYQKIISVLTDEQIKMADEMQKYMAFECSKWGNRVTEKMFGYKKFNEEDYFPLKTDAHSRAVTNKTDNNVGYNTLKNSSFTKQIVPSANNAVMLEDIFDVFTSHVEQMANYDGFVMPIADAMRWFNYSEKVVNATEEGSRVDVISNMQEAIESVIGTAGTKYFRDFIKNINGIYEGTGGNIPFADKLASGYKAQAVMANLRVVAQQPTAIARAADRIEDRYLIAALVPKIGERFAKKAQQNSTLAYWKAQGYYETLIGQSMKSIITGEQSVKDKINEVGGYLAGKADDITWGVIYRAAELKVSHEHPELEYDSKEYTAEVVKMFESIIDHTQVVDTIFHKSQVMRSQNAGVKMLTAFMAEPTLTLNMTAHRLHEAGIALANGNKVQAAVIVSKLLRVLAANGLLVSLAQSLFDAFRDDDENRDTWAKILYYWFGISEEMTIKDVVLSNFVDNLNPLNWIPVAKEIMSYIQGYDSSNMYVDAIYSAADSVTELAKIATGSSTKTTYGKIYTVAKGLSQLTGVPASNFIREIRTLNNNLNYLWDGDKWYSTTKAEQNAAKIEAQNEFHLTMEAGNDFQAIMNVYNDNIEAGKSESDSWSAARDALKAEFLRIVREGNEPLVSVQNRFRTLLKKTKYSNGTRAMSEKEVENLIKKWTEEIQ